MKKALIWLILYSALASVLIRNLFEYGVFLFLAFQKGIEGFWKPVATSVPRDPSEVRILNPYFIQEAAFQFIGLPQNNGLMGKGVSFSPIVISGGLNEKNLLFENVLQ